MAHYCDERGVMHPIFPEKIDDKAAVEAAEDENDAKPGKAPKK